MNTKTGFPKLLRILVVCILVGSSLLILPTNVGQAVTYPKPPWWTGANGANCNDTNYYNSSSPHTHSTVITTWNGVQVCGPRPIAGGPNVSVQFSYSSTNEGEWQCTELVKRYLLMAFSVPSVAADGDEVVTAYADAYPDTFDAIANDGATEAFPKVGDVISYSNVHTAVIIGVTVTDEENGDATLSLIEQNASSSGTTTQKVEGWVIKGGIDDPDANGSDTVTGWLTPVWTVKSVENPGTYNALRGITALSSDDIWAVGSSTATIGGVSQTFPTAFHWDGSAWSSNANGTNYQGNLLNGTSAISSSNVVAVGSSIYSVGFAMKYNGTSWSSITVDRPGSTSPLNAVSSESGGDTWAVGYSLQSGYYRPLFEHYNGSSAFTKVGDPFPTASGTADTRLMGVSVYSSSDAWAVGYSMNYSYQRHPVTLHYNGTSWSYQTTPDPSGSVINVLLYAVKMIATDNVWAVGTYSYSTTPGVYEPLVMHWDGTNWTVDTTPDPLLHGYLYAIQAASSDTVYVAGWTQTVGSPTNSRPLILRYDGSSWSEVSVPTYISDEFKGVAVIGSSVDDPVWAVGDGSSNYNLIQLGRVK